MIIAPTARLRQTALPPSWWREASFPSSKPDLSAVALIHINGRGAASRVPRQCGVRTNIQSLVTLINHDLRDAGPDLAYLLRRISWHGVGTRDLKRIELIGQPIERVRVDYRKHKG